jgi:amino acid transporter
VSDVLACGGIAAALADVAASVFPGRLAAPVHAAVIIGVIGGIALVNIGGVARGAHLVGATTALKLMPLAIFIVVGAAAMHGANFVYAFQTSSAGFGRAVILAMFAFVGMETSLCASGEVARPNRAIPQALAIAMLTVTFLYVAVQVVAQGLMGAALARSTVPLADAMAHVHPALRVLMLAGAALSMFGWISSDILGSPRQLFAFARDGLLPQALARLHPQSHAPQAAILCYAALAVIVALTGTFAELAVLATLAGAGLYIAGCAAAWLLARRGVAVAGTPLEFRWLGMAAAVGIAGMLTLIALASAEEIVGLISLVALSVLMYTVRGLGLFAKG